MIRELALALLLPAAMASDGQPENSTEVTGLRVEPGAGATEVVVELTGRARSVDHFHLEDPARIVVDVHGARNALPRNRFDAINRGGIRAVRTSQYRPDVVRVVIDLERTTGYTVADLESGVLIALSGADTSFDAWSTGGGDGRAARGQPASEARPYMQVPLAQQPEAERITVTFHDAEIRDVLASFAEFTGLSIVPGRGVSGISVTAEIRDQPWDIALQTILRAYGLAAAETQPGILRVDAIEALREREEQETLVTQTFRINYVPVQELVTALQPLQTGRGSVTVNPSTNTLIVTDVESAVERIAPMIQQLDIQTPQVAIKAHIVVVNRTRALNLGFRYAIGTEFTTTNGTGTGGNGTTGTGGVALQGPGVVRLGDARVQLGEDVLGFTIPLISSLANFGVFLEASQELSISDVQAAPLITALDNQEAEIFVGEETPIRVVDVGGAEQIGQARATAQLVETGILLRVTPHITAGRQIMLELEAENSTAQLVPTEIGVQFLRQRGITRLLVDDGETAVIGGLSRTITSQVRAGIPLLMDIPILGALFRSTGMEEETVDLIIMVTPRIIDANTRGVTPTGIQR